MGQYTEFQTIFFLYEEADSCWHDLSKSKLELWRWIVSSRHALMPAAGSHQYSIHLSPSSPLFWGQASGEGDQGGRRTRLPRAMDFGVLPCCFWLFASRSKGKEGQNNRTKISKLGICLISGLVCKIILFGMAPKITSSCKQERWVLQPVTTTMYILRTWKY